jgi:putative flavoprotein involved in K+ transport
MNVSRIPPIASRLPPRLVQVSALDYRRPDQLPVGAVLVVGAGQSGGQIVEDLLKAGRPVYWSVSAVIRQPRRYRGRDTLAWLYDSGFFDATLEQVSDPAVRNATIPLISGVGRYGHTLSLQWLADKGARLVGRIQHVEDGVLHLDDRVAECIRFGDRRALEICDEIDDFIRNSGQTPPALENDEANDVHPDPDSVRSPARLDLAALDVESVVWATGVTGDFSYLPSGSTDSQGVPLQRHGVSPLDGLFYAGLPWMTHRSSGILHGPETDAMPVASRVAERSAA